MEGLEALEQWGPVAALRNSFVAYPLVNALHIAAIGALVTSALLMDLRILGRLQGLAAERFVPVMRRVAMGGSAVAALSGLALFSIRATEYLTNPAFLTKLALLLLAGLNVAVFHVLLRYPDAEPYPPAARLSAAASLVLWPAILIAGRFIGFL